MRTLDEVIEAERHCIGIGCQGCPYDIVTYGGSCECSEDALHYLKEYRKMKEHLACLDDAEIRGDNTQVVNNPPLTWDELKQMEGKPVWVEWLFGCWKDKKKWVIVGKAFENYLTFATTDIVQGYGGTLYKCHVGEAWQAYRKERE